MLKSEEEFEMQVSQIFFPTQMGEGMLDLNKKEVFINDIQIDIPIQKEVPQNRIYLKFSSDCNLKCEYCFQKERKKVSKKAADIKEYHLLFKELSQKHFEQIVLFGGEPFLDKNIEIIKLIFSYFTTEKFIVYTNGNFSEQVFSLIETNIHRFSYFLFTIDGREDIHNKRRVNPKSNSFKNIVTNIYKLSKITKVVDIQVNIDKNNLEEVYHFMDFVLSDSVLSRHNIVINPVKYHTMSMNDLELLDVFLKLKSRYRDKLSLSLNQKAYRNITNFLSGYPIAIERCNVGFDKVFDFETEKIYTCPQNEETVIGCFDKRNYFVVEDRCEDLHKKVSKEFAKCQECIYKIFCGKGCLYDTPTIDCQKEAYEIINKILQNFDTIFDIKN